MKKILIIFSIVLALVSCTKDLTELNKDTKNPTEVPGETLFTNATRNLSDLMANCNVNRNVFRLYSQYWAQTTYPDESQYNMVTRKNPDNYWLIIYRNVLKDYDEAYKILEAEVPSGDAETIIKNNKLAIISVMEVYSYSILVDLFGDVPYSQALDDSNVLPAYDDAKTIYYDIITKLDAAIADLSGSESFSSTEDNVYQGDVTKWKKFAYSLKLRLALRIADYDNSKASSMVTDAASHVFTSNSDNFSHIYYADPPNTNPLWVDLVQSGRSDFVAANTFVDKLNELGDPRLLYYFTDPLTFNFRKVSDVEQDSVVSSGSTMTYIYESALDGSDSIVRLTPPYTIYAKDADKNIRYYAGGIYGSGNAYGNFSHFCESLYNPSFSGTMMNYAEVEFLLAEAAERGYTISGSAEDHYKAGIEASILEWGGTSSDVDAYYSNEDVAYSTASGTWRQKIGIQKWISLYNEGLEGWSTWRQFDFVAFNVPDGMEYSDIPVRFIYPISEATLNNANYLSAAAKYDDDSSAAKVFWDVN